MSYLGIPPFGRTSRTVTEVAAISGQTTFYPTGGYTVGYIDVVLNGIQLNTTDFTATDGLAVVLLSPAAVNDELHFTSYTVNVVEIDTSALAPVALSGTFADLTAKPTTISGYGITDAQTLDADLTAIAALTGTTGLLKKTAANTWTLDTSTYLTGITSGQVTTALGFTPYNATNPNGYISSITSSNVTTALGYTPYNATNPSGYTNNTGTVTSVSGTGTVSGLTLTGSVSTTGSLTLGGALSLTSSNVTTALGYTPENPANRGTANGYATLDGSGLVPSTQLPSYVDDVIEYANLASFPATGTSGKIFVAIDTNKTYRWSGSAYVYITSGAVDSVAGKTGVVSLVSSDVGLGNVENKSSATIRSEISSANVTTALGFTPYNATNPSGYITGITSGNVTTALGFTPYNSSNPAGYITGITSSNVTTALGFTPYNATNPNGYITGYTETDTLATVTARGGTTSGGITINSGIVDQGLTMTVSDGGWNYIGFSHGATRKAYFGLDGSGNPQWGSDSGAFTITGNYTTIGTSTRSPIFYDSDNTGYYVDAASQSLLNRLKVSGGDSSSATQIIESSVYPMLDFISTSTDTNNRNWRIAGVYNNYGLLQILSSTSANGTPSTARLAINGSSGYVGIGAAATGASNWLQIGSVGSTGYGGNHIVVGDGTNVFAQYLNGATNMGFYTNSGYFSFDKYIQASGSMRSPVFYDSGDTSYYLDAAGGSNIGSLTSNSSVNVQTGTGPFVYQQITNTDSGGTYAYLQLTASGAGSGYLIKNRTTGNSVTNQSLYLWNDPGPIEFVPNGSIALRTTISTGGSMTVATDIRAPIFYDSDNTAYYTNPATTSNFFDLGITGASHKYLYLNPGNGYEAMIRYNGGSGSGWYVGKRTASVIVGSESFHFYSEAAGATVAGIDTGGNSFSSTSYRAPVFYDLDNTGYYLNPASSSVLDSVTANSITSQVNGMPNGGNSISGMGYATTWDARPGGIYDRYAINWHTGISLSGYPSYGGVRLYSAAYPSLTNSTLRLEASTGVYTYGQFTNDNRVDAPIFYDYNNTAYYTNPASTSVLNALTVADVTAGSLISTSYVQLNGPIYRAGPGTGYMNGQYASSENGGSSGPIYSIGGSYLPGTTSLGNMYGVGYAVGNISGIGIVANWGFYVASGGVARIFLDSDAGVGYASNSFRAPYFYDRDNTSYYVDAAGTTVLNALTVGGQPVTAGGGGSSSPLSSALGYNYI